MIPRRVEHVRLAILLAAAAVVSWEAARYVLADGARGRFHLESRWFILAAVAVAIGASRPFSGMAATSGRGTSPRDAAAVVVAAVAFAVLVYAPAVAIGYLSDDYVLVDRAGHGDALSVRGGFWRPLSIWIFGLGDSVGGPAILHLFTIVLHGLNGALVGALAMAVGMSRGQAAATAALFIVFPASPEAVAWISGLQDVLMTTTVLLGCIAWGGGGRSWRPAVLVLAALLTGLATKETAVALPLLGLILWSGRLPPRRNVAIALPAAILGGGYAVWRLAGTTLPADYAQAPSRWLLKEHLARVFGGLAFPFHDDLGAAGAFAALVIGVAAPFLVAASARRWRRGEPPFDTLVRLATWILVAPLPVYAYLYVTPDLQGSRYLYLPSAGWAIFVVALLDSAFSGRVGRVLVAALVAITIAVNALVLQVHLRAWQEAAAERDAVLAAGHRARAAYACGGPGSTYEGPDSVRGAYVFRNGLAEALGASSGPPCALRWVDRGFVPK